jgi:hypothetical protein
MNFVTSNVANGNYLILNSELYELNSTVTHSLANNVYGEYYSYTYNKRFNESTVIVTANIIYSIAGWGADTFKSRLKLVTNSITTYSLENNQKFASDTYAGGGTRSGTLTGMYAQNNTSGSNVTISFMISNVSANDPVTLTGIQYFIVEQKNTLASLPLNYTVNSSHFTLSNNSNINLKNNFFINSPANANNIYYNQGNVAIGTNTPISQLHIHNPISAGEVKISLTDNDSGTTSTDGFAIIKNTDESCRIWNYENTSLTLGTNNLDRLTILNDGNVGIGIVNPRNKLHISSGLSTVGMSFPLKISATAYNGAGLSGTFIGLNTEDSSWSKCAIGHVRTGTFDQGAIVFLCRNTQDDVTVDMTNERMRVTSGGNVGIGTNNPQQKLHVEDGSLFIGDAAYISTPLSTPNTYRLMFDSTYNATPGSGNICNKILLHNQTVFNAGFGIEQGALVYQSGENHRFYTGTTSSVYGTERFTILNGGNVGIGSGSPSERLDIGSGNFKTTGSINSGAITCTTITTNNNNITVGTGTITNGALVTSVSISTPILSNAGNLNITATGANNLLFNTNGSEKIRVDANGNVGISTNAPITTLDVGLGTIKTTRLSNNADLNISASGANQVILSTNSIERFKIASDGSITTNNHSINTGTAGVTATTITGSTSLSTPTLTTTGNLNITTTGANNLIFNTNGTEKVRIDSTGNLGIGTNNPQYKLDVNGVTNTTQLFSCNISTSNLSVFGDTTILNTTVYQTEQLQVVNDTTATSMIIRQVNVNQNVAEFYNNSNNLSLIIKNNGNVGIGSTNPTEKLDLGSGNFKTTGSITSGSITSASITTNNNNINAGIATITTGALVASVSINTPILSNAGNLNISATGTNNLLFNTNGNERIRIDSSGNLGIGTNNPTSLLELNASTPTLKIVDVSANRLPRIELLRGTNTFGSDIFTDWRIENNTGNLNFLRQDTTYSGNSLTLDYLGNVGIGTTNPNSLLHLHNNNASGEVRISLTDGNSSVTTTDGFAIIKNGDESCRIWNYENTSLTLGTNNLDRLTILSGGNIGIGTNNPQQKLHIVHTNNNLIRIETDTNNIGQTSGIEFGIPAFASATRSKITSTTLSGDASDLQFYTSPSTINSTLRLTITKDGNVGIGNIAPSQILQVGNAGRLRIANGSGDYSLLGTIDTDGATNTRIVISGRDRGGTNVNGNIEYVSTGSAGNHLFFTTDSTSEKLRIANSGNVGIGTNNPTSLLHLHNANASGEVKITLSDGNTGTGSTDGFSIIKNGDDSCRIWNYENTSLILGTNNLDRLTVSSNGNVGIANTIPIATLSIGTGLSSVNNDGSISVGKSDGVGNNRKFKFGYDSSYNFILGDWGGGNLDTEPWTKQISIAYNAPNNSLRILGNGNVGIGSENPTQRLDLGTGNLITSGTLTANSLINNANLTIQTSTASDIILNTNNSEKVRIKSSGFVGIGTTNPNTSLHIHHTSTSAAGDNAGLYIYNPNNSANNSSIVGTRIAGNSANKCGYAWDVSGFYGWSAYINGNDTTDKGLRFNNSFTAGGGNDRFIIYNNGNVNIPISLSVGTTRQPLETLDVLGKIASINAATWDHIRMWNDGQTGFIDAGGAENGLAFRIDGLANSYPATSYPEKMRILTNGNVGIGLNNPNSLLHLHNTNASGEVRISLSDGNSGITSTDGFAIIKDTNENSLLWNYENTYLAFATNNSEKVRITATGFVGIGTTNPLANLDMGTGTIKTSILSNNADLNIQTSTANGIIFGTSGSEKIRIDSSGNLGIGTTNPTEKLDLRGGNAVIGGNLYPLTDITYDLGTSSKRWRDLYLSGNTINLGGLLLSKSVSESFEIKDTSGNLKNVVSGSIITSKLSSESNLTFESSNSIIINTSNIERLRITSNGFVGIGSTIPIANLDMGLVGTIRTSNLSNNANLRINTSGQNHLIFGTNDTERLRIFNDGNVTFTGYGANAKSVYICDRILDPGSYDFREAPLSVFYSKVLTSGSVLNDPKPVFNMARDGTSGTNYACTAIFNLSRWENNGTNSRTRMDLTMSHGIMDNVNVMTIRSDGNVGLGTQTPTQRLDLGSGNLATNTVTNNNADLNIQTSTANSIIFKTSGTEKIRINNSGYLGIGTNNPLENLSVTGGTNQARLVTLRSTTTTYSSYIGFQNSTDNKTCYVGIDGLGLCDIERGALLMGTFNNQSIIFTTGATSTEKMRITSGGDVGIGVNPSFKLDVSGIINTNNYFNISASSSTASGLIWQNQGASAIGVAGVGGQYSASADGGDMIIRANTGKKLILQTGASTGAVFINNNNVGIGTTNPNSLFHLHNNNASGEVRISLTDGNSGTTTTDGFAIIKDANENCSIWNYENTSLSFATSNTERFRITSNGFVGIGSTIPIANLDMGTGTIKTSILSNNADLNITASGANNIIFNTNGTSKLTITNDGKIGVGITNPQALLHIPTPDSDSTTTNLLDFKNINGYGIYSTTTSINSRGNTITFNSRDFNSGGTITTRNILTLRPEGHIGINNINPSSLYILDANGIINTNTGYNISASSSTASGITWNNQGSSAIGVAGVAGNFTSSAIAGDMVIRSDTSKSLILLNGSGNGTLFIKGNNVGIAKTNPNFNLDVNGIINTTQLFSCNISTSNLNVFGDTTILNTTVYQTEQLQVVNDTTATSMIIRQVNVNQNVAEFYNNSNNLNLIINKDGNIGIGITNPTANLDLGSGSIKTSILSNNANLNLTVTGSTNNLIFNTNGSEKIRIDANGKLGIGTNNPSELLTLNNGNLLLTGTWVSGSSYSIHGYNSGKRLEFDYDKGTGIYDNNRITFYTGVSSEKMRISNNGNVGIGFTNPQQLLSVNGPAEFASANGNKLLFSYTNNDYRHRIYTSHNANADSGNHFDFYTWRQGQGVNDEGDRHCLRLSAIYTHFPSSTNKYFWINNRINDFGNNDYTSTPLTVFNQTASSSTVLNDPQRVLALVRQGTNSQSHGQTATFKLSRWENSSIHSRTRLDLDLSDISNDDVNVMTIRTDGRVGIGSQIPTQRLDLGSGNFTTTGTLTATSFLSSSTLTIQTNNSNNIVLNTNGANERLRITSSGLVGIGTTNPISRFTIRGDYNNINNNFCLDASDTTGLNSQYNLKIYPYVIGGGQVGYKFRVVNATTTETDALTIDHNGAITTANNLDVGGGLAITGANAFFETGAVTDANETNTYINFKFAGTGSDWCYLRQIGGTNAYKLAFDFLDDNNDCRFVLRSVQSAAADPDIITEKFSVDGDNTTLNNLYANGNVGIGTNNANSLLHIHNTNASGQVRISLTDGNSGTTTTDGFAIIKDANENALLWNYENTSLSLATNNLERFTINSSGFVGIGSTIPIANLDMALGTIKTTNLSNNADLNIQTSTANSIIFGTSGNEKIRIDSSGKLGIGITNPLSLFEIINNNYTGPLLTIDTGILNATTQMPRSIGQPMLKIGKNSYSTTAGDYYGIGFGYAPSLTDKNCCEIGCIITDKTGSETGDLLFSTRSTTANNSATERLRINSSGFIGIGTTNPISKLTIRGSYVNLDDNFCLDASDVTGVNNKYNFKIYPYYINGGQIGYKFRIISNTTNINDGLTFSDLGNVAIGNVTPTQIFQVGNAGRLRISNGTTDFSLLGTIDTDGGTNTRIVVSGNTRTSYNGRIDYFATSTGAHVWNTTDSGTEKMRLTSTGSLGIGTNNPNANSLLHLHNTNASGEVRISLSDGNSGTTTTDGFAIIKDSNEKALLWNYENTSLSLATNNLERFTINSNGNIGIGTTNPNVNYSLDVNGTINCTSILVNGSAVTAGSSSLNASSQYTVGGIFTNLINNSQTNPLNIQTSNTQPILFSTGSSTPTERLRIDSAGNIGIGRSIPSYLLDVNGTVFASNLIVNDLNISNEIKNNILLLNYYVEYNNNINSNLVYLTNINFSNVAFTASNNSNFLVNYNNLLNEPFFNSGSNIYSLSNFRIGIGISNPTSPFQIGNGGRFSISSNDVDRTIIGTNDVIDSINNTSIVLNGRSRTSTSGYIQYNATNNGFHIWNTNDGSSVTTERMRLTSDGNVGIGTNSPLQKLHVEDGSLFIGDSAFVTTTSTTPNGYKLIFDNSYNSTVGTGNICNKILLHNTSSFNAGFGIETSALVYQSGLNHRFYTGTTSSAYGTERFTILSGGNVGIGSASPGERLDLGSGNFKTTGTINSGGITCTSINNTGNWTWTQGANYLLNATANGQEWSFDLMNQTNTTGCFWHVWSDKSGIGAILACRGDTGNVGVRNTNPSVPLDVTGEIKTDTKLTIGQTYLQDGLLSFVTNWYTSGKIQFGVGTWQTYPGASIERVGSQFNSGTGYANRLELWCVDIGGCLNNGFYFYGAPYVGIGTMPDRNYGLSVQGNSRFSGNIGIGTTNPNSLLHLHNTNAAGEVRLSLTDGNSGVATTDGFAIIKDSSENCLLWNYENTYLSLATNNAERMRIAAGGNVGIGNNNPIGLLTIGDSSVVGSDGNIVIGKNTGGGASRHYKIGIDANYDFIIGDFGNNNSAGTWLKQFALNYGAPANSFYLHSSGRIGIGTNNPNTTLHIEHSSTSAQGAGGGLYVFNPNNTANSCSVIGTRIGGSSANKCGYSWDVSGQFGWSVSINGNDMANKLLRFNPTWDATGTDVMTLNNSGNLSINGTFTGSGQTNQITNGTDAGVSFNVKNNSSGGNAFSQIGVYNSANNWAGLFLNSPSRSADGGVNTLTLRNDAGDLRLSAKSDSPYIYLQNSSGNVGIGTNNPRNKLHISTGLATAGMSFPLKISASAIENLGNNTGTFIGLNTEDSSWSKCAIGHVRTGSYDQGSIVFLCRNTADDQTVTMSYERMRITAGGNVGIGTNNPAVALHVVGDIAATGDLIGYYSDIRLKKVHSNIEKPFEIINNLNGFYYSPNELGLSYGMKDKVQIGLSAQEVQKVLPEIVNKAPFDITLDENGELKSKSQEDYLTVSYERLVPVMIEALKENNKTINELKEEIKLLKKLINNK